MVIISTPTVATFDGSVILAAANVNPSIEDLPGHRRFYPFHLIISQPFTDANNSIQLALSDESSPYENKYILVDRLNKKITGYQLYKYAGRRKCIDCVYDDLYKVVRVNSCICPDKLNVPDPPCHKE